MKTTAIEQRWITSFNLLILGLAMLVLSACGGGGSGGDSSTPPGATPTAGLASGTIEGFGSVIVNGVKFEVEGAEVEFEHGTTVIISNATQTLHLNEGMQVEVEGSFDDNGQTGTATRIILDDELEGEITALSTNATTGVVTFTILGQTVLAISGATFIDDSAPLSSLLANLAVGQFVEVHGLPDGAGTIQATFIEYKAANQASFDLNAEGELELTGVITAMGTGTLSIGSQLVDTTSAIIDGPLSIGTLVEVKGTLNGTTLEATLVHVEDGFGNQLARIEIEGLVRNLTASQFSLNGQQVDYSTATFFGGVQSDLINGLKVEAEGPIVGGLLVARKIKFKDSFRYEGAVTEVNANTLSISVPAPAGGTLTVLVDSAIARVDAGLDFSLNNAKLRARVTNGSTLVATRVRDGGILDSRQIFEGPVVAFSLAADSVEMLDDGIGGGQVEVDTSLINDITHPSGSDFEIEDVKVSKAAFYQALNLGDRVKARHDNGSWDQIEIELED